MLRSFGGARLGMSGAFVQQQRRRIKLGYRPKQNPPDRMRDSFAYCGMDLMENSPEDVPFKNETQREHMLSSIMNTPKSQRISNENLDAIPKCFRAAIHSKPGSDKYKEIYSHLRSSEFSTLLWREEFDPPGEGKPVWVNMAECDVQRKPWFFELPNGEVVLPVFSTEFIMFHYFMWHNIYPSVSQFHVKCGSQTNKYKQLDFPVLAIGTMKHMSMLATAATPHQVPIVINPRQTCSKFVTYPEMVAAATKQTDSDSLQVFHKIFNTNKWVGKPLEPHQVPECSYNEPLNLAVPYIAQTELTLLLFNFPTVEGVYVRPTRGLMSSIPGLRTPVNQRETELAVVMADGADDDETVKNVLKAVNTWSFLSEVRNSSVVFVKAANFTVTPETLVVYTKAKGAIMSETYCGSDTTLRVALDFDKPFDQEFDAWEDFAPPKDVPRSAMGPSNWEIGRKYKEANPNGSMLPGARPGDQPPVGFR